MKGGVKICPVCGDRFSTGAGLASHRRAKHKRYKGPNRLATEQLIAELGKSRQIDALDVADVQAARALADQLDFDPSNAQMWRAYADALQRLKSQHDQSDTFAKFLEEINSRAPIRNPAAE